MGCTCSNDPGTEDTSAIQEHQPRIPRKQQSDYSEPSAESTPTKNETLRVDPLNMELVPAMISVDDISPLPMLQESENPVRDLSNIMTAEEVIASSDFKSTYDEETSSISSKGTSHHRRYSNLISSETSMSWKKEEIEQVAHEMRRRISSPLHNRRSSTVRNRRSSNLISKGTRLTWNKEDIDHVHGEMQRQLSLLKYESGSDHHELYNDKLVIQQQQKQIEQLQKELGKFIAQQSQQMQ